MIPKTFHRIWLGDQPMPEEFHKFWLAFIEMHPGWKFRTWSDAIVDYLQPFYNRAIYDQATTLAGRADVLRLEILAKHGGVYVDCDVEPLRPYDPLVEDDRAFGGWEDYNNVCTAVLGCPPQHPAMVDLVMAMGAWVADRPYATPNEQTGPVFVTEHWRDRWDVRLFPPEVFYPVPPGERELLTGTYPETAYSVHHWAYSWENK